MKMVIKKYNFDRIVLSDEERESLNIADKVLETLYNRYIENIELESQLTGECLGVEEIPRVRGILGMLAEYNQLFEIKER